MKKTVYILLLLLTVSTVAIAQRRVTPVNNAATRTQPRRDAEADSARELQRRRDRSIHYHDDNGNIVMVDTVTGVEWTDSTLLPKAPPMKYPLLHNVSAGINIFDPIMRAFGAKYGGADASVALSLHNRYIPTFEFGLGTAHKTPAAGNYTYRSPLAPYFKLGLDYNFMYNSNPKYMFYAGLRYGFSAFKYNLTDITVDNGYWGGSEHAGIPSTSATAGWVEVLLGLKVQIAGPVSAGWAVRYHGILHCTNPATGQPWYVPGYGPRTSTLAASFSIYWTLPLTGPSPEPKQDLQHAD